MSALLIDVGNTRVKWARFTNGKLRAQRAAAHEGWKFGDFARQVFHGAQDIEQIIVVSVAGTRIEKRLVTAARVTCGVAPRFIKTQRTAAGVTTRYQEPWRLGVDRFVAAIGAHHLVGGRSVCVVDIGTAMTLDLVDAHGIHRGGAIVPGPDLMRDSLLKDTSGIHKRARSKAVAGGLFARNTRAALEQGARYSSASIVERAVTEAHKTLGERPLVVLTGGAAPTVHRLLRVKHRLVPDLVLRGLTHLV